MSRPDPPPPRSLSALRRQIDAVDDQLLALLEQRLELARQVGGAKSAEPSPYLNLKPDREAHVLGRLIARAEPGTKPLALSLWREVMAAGLAVQGEITVEVWAEADRTDWIALARGRFGAPARYRLAHSASAALEAAASASVVSLLALEPEHPWWTELAGGYPDLWVFEVLHAGGARGDRAAVALARIDPLALAAGPRVQVLAPGASSPASARQLVETGGWRLVLDDAPHLGVAGADRRAGVVGQAGRLAHAFG